MSYNLLEFETEANEIFERHKSIFINSKNKEELRLGFNTELWALRDKIIYDDTIPYSEKTLMNRHCDKLQTRIKNLTKN